MGLKFRQATEDDIPALRELIPVAARVLSEGLYNDRQIESAIKYIFGVDTQLITDGTYYVAAAQHHLVGCGGWSKRKTLYGGDQMKGEVDELLDPVRDAARIRAFFVHPGLFQRVVTAVIFALVEQLNTFDNQLG